SSLGGIRPVSQIAGQALERAVSGDDNMRARLHAKTILMKYHIAGYSSAPRNEARGPSGVTTSEPPLLEPGVPRGTHASGARAAGGHITTQEPPPLAPFPTGPASGGKSAAAKVPSIVNKSDDVLEFRPSTPRGFTTAVPQQKNQQPPAPLPMVEEDG